jgi:hypothetical protein
MTDAGAGRLLGDDAAVNAARRTAQLATPAVLSPWARTRLAFLTDISILPDGKAAAVAVISDPLTPPRGRQTFLFVFVRQGDRWLIDDLVSFSIPRRSTAAATPVAGTPRLPSLLIATEAGRPVFEQLGYMALFRFSLWSRDRPQP